ncbi:signal peptide containing protein [Theileria equi strain WA]|uniref:Signal peptide containing protein n=1 Tax=Theileria equi strain WA TaxID=1537102 RepID=L1LE73_THEEQ|nr:signal peptide containing protein [Theileria equi strain WA]EKX73550.1 signal peptide containing protein [Theileria equi strain WA]|eukprot:XP_004833002.1 signal peptide containing protein [Theileria equi strain WA]
MIAIWSFVILLVPVFAPLPVTAQRRVLDISRPINPEEVIVSEYNEEGLTYRLFLPRVHILIGKVIDRDRLIWLAPSRFENCSSFRVVRDGNNIVFALLRSKLGYETKNYYFMYVEAPPSDRAERSFLASLVSPWRLIPESEYRERLATMVNRKFDLSAHYDYRFFNIQNYQELGIPSYIYTPREEYLVKRVMDGDDIIWQSTRPEERCSLILLHGGELHSDYIRRQNRENKRVLRLYIHHHGGKDSLYFEKTGTGWVPITREAFYEEMEHGAEDQVTKL